MIVNQFINLVGYDVSLPRPHQVGVPSIRDILSKDQMPSLPALIRRIVYTAAEQNAAPNAGDAFQVNSWRFFPGVGELVVLCPRIVQLRSAALWAARQVFDDLFRCVFRQFVQEDSHAFVAHEAHAEAAALFRPSLEDSREMFAHEIPVAGACRFHAALAVVVREAEQIHRWQCDACIHEHLQAVLFGQTGITQRPLQKEFVILILEGRDSRLFVGSQPEDVDIFRPLIREARDFLHLHRAGCAADSAHVLPSLEDFLYGVVFLRLDDFDFYARPFLHVGTEAHVVLVFVFRRVAVDAAHIGIFLRGEFERDGGRATTREPDEDSSSEHGGLDSSTGHRTNHWSEWRFRRALHTQFKFGCRFYVHRFSPAPSLSSAFGAIPQSLVLGLRSQPRISHTRMLPQSD